MSEWALRRVWSDVSVHPVTGGYGVRLDDRPVHTPAKRPFVVPTRAMAEQIAAEWSRQGDRVDPLSMPVTRSANAAIDKVAVQHAEVVEALAAYGATDLLCYRATRPEALAGLQTQAWDPLLDWAAEALDARLVPVGGVMPREQDAAALERLAERVRALPAFPLTAFHDLVMLSGSLILAFAVVEGRLSGAAAWEASRIDEEWQAQQWGRDAEADAAAEAKREAFLHAERFFRLACSH